MAKLVASLPRIHAFNKSDRIESHLNHAYSYTMPAINLKAHFDGQQIVLDEPYELSNGTPLMVTVLPTVTDNERADWASISAAGLARAYSDNEPEYTAADVKS